MLPVTLDSNYTSVGRPVSGDSTWRFGGWGWVQTRLITGPMHVLWAIIQQSGLWFQRSVGSHLPGCCLEAFHSNDRCCQW